MFGRKKEEPKPLLKFDMKIICEYGDGVTNFTYQTTAETADKAINAVLIEMGGEKVVCFGGGGRSIVFPRTKLVYLEALFVEVVEENK